jgi:hypothetical protein
VPLVLDDGGERERGERGERGGGEGRHLRGGVHLPASVFSGKYRFFRVEKVERYQKG